MALQLRTLVALQRTKFKSQNPHGDSQWSITPVLGDLMTSDTRLTHSADTHADKTSTHMKVKIKELMSVSH